MRAQGLKPSKVLMQKGNFLHHECSPNQVNYLRSLLSLSRSGSRRESAMSSRGDFATPPCPAD